MEMDNTEIDQTLVYRTLELINKLMPEEKLTPNPIIVAELNYGERQAVFNQFDNRGVEQFHSEDYDVMRFYVPARDGGASLPGVEVYTPGSYLKTIDEVEMISRSVAEVHDIPYIRR